MDSKHAAVVARIFPAIEFDIRCEHGFLQLNSIPFLCTANHGPSPLPCKSPKRPPYPTDVGIEKVERHPLSGFLPCQPPGMCLAPPRRINARGIVRVSTGFAPPRQIRRVICRSVLGSPEFRNLADAP